MIYSPTDKRNKYRSLVLKFEIIMIFLSPNHASVKIEQSHVFSLCFRWSLLLPLSIDWFPLQLPLSIERFPLQRPLSLSVKGFPAEKRFQVVSIGRSTQAVKQKVDGGIGLVQNESDVRDFVPRGEARLRIWRESAIVNEMMNMTMRDHITQNHTTIQ